MAIDDTVRMEAFEGKPVHLYVQEALSNYPALAKNAQFKHYLSAAVDQMVLMITTWCISGVIPTRMETEHVSYPDGPWQAFKDRYFPKWLLTRFPVRLVERNIERNVYHYFVCPHLVTDPQTQHIRFMATGSPLAVRMGGR